MFHLNGIKNGNTEDHNKKWPYIGDYPYRMLIIERSGS